jgi:hypothetical protein
MARGKMKIIKGWRPEPLELFMASMAQGRGGVADAS